MQDFIMGGLFFTAAYILFIEPILPEAILRMIWHKIFGKKGKK